jgi:hypothetical protein
MKKEIALCKHKDPKACHKVAGLTFDMQKLTIGYL